MGTAYRGTCPCCKYAQTFYLEGGMMSANLERSMMVLPDSEREAVRAMMDRRDIDRFLAENYIAECPDCGRVEGRPIIQIYDRGGARHIYGRQCGHCGGQMRIHWENAKAAVTCPDCHRGTIAFEEEGLWD